MPLRSKGHSDSKGPPPNDRRRGLSATAHGSRGGSAISLSTRGLRHADRFRLSKSSRTFRTNLAEVVSEARDSDATHIDANVRNMDENEVLDRYHELIDKRLTDELNYRESFELDRIEARLNAEDETELRDLRATQEEWQRERLELVSSIERLLSLIVVKSGSLARTLLSMATSTTRASMQSI